MKHKKEIFLLSGKISILAEEALKNTKVLWREN